MTPSDSSNAWDTSITEYDRIIASIMEDEDIPYEDAILRYNQNRADYLILYEQECSND